MRNRKVFSVLSAILLFVLCLSLNASAVEPVLIENFNISFSSGADLVNGKYVWSPDDPVSGHMFVYKLDYSLSGTFSSGKGALKFELPLHILKDRDGNWADEFDCSFKQESELSQGEEPEFVYKIENDKAVIYNYKEYNTGTAGYIEFAYITTKPTFDYRDMTVSTTVPGTVYATNEASTVTKKSEGVSVGIDTHAVISGVSKAVPTLYKTWDNSWGTKPGDADSYVYLVWPVVTDVSKVTQPYDLELVDNYSSLGGSVVGYKFSGQGAYSSINVIKNQKQYGKRYDYVLTRHSKSQADALFDKDSRYEVINNVKAIVHPLDKVDADSVKSASRSWWVEIPKFIYPTGHFWTEKRGVFGNMQFVNSSEDVSNYSLEEFQEGVNSSIDDISYYTYVEGFPYPWTLGSGADGTVNDALNNRYGQKKVDYELVDDEFYLEDSDTALSSDDYDVTGMTFIPMIRDATFDTENLKFVESGLSSYKTEDAITIWVKVNGSWKKACVYDMATRSYLNVDENYVKSAKGNKITYQLGVDGVKITCSNAYYRTRVTLYPDVSLYNTKTVVNLIGMDTNKLKVKLTNRAIGTVRQDGKVLFTRTVDGIDYICRTTKTSELKKDVVQTRSDKVLKQCVVSWRTVFHEDRIDDESITGVPQISGKFYDLLPIGGLIDRKSIVVKASGANLSEGSYELEFIDNYKNSGRTLMVVSINRDTNQYYELEYSTVHSYDAIQDYGKHLLNSVVYESGNKLLSDGLDNSGGNITDHALLSGFGDENKNVFLYAEARYDIDVLTAGSTGLQKMVRGPYDSAYSYNSVVFPGSDYSYQVRYANDALTSSKDMIFFDSLESFYQKENEISETITSEWKGTLESIDVSQLKDRGIKPVVYLSKIDAMNLYKHHDLNEVKNGENVWIEYSKFIEKYGIESAHAVCVDASKSLSGYSFVLEPGESIVFTLYMQAPDSGEIDTFAYNNIFVQRSVMKNLAGESSFISQFFHQDYTQVELRLVGDVQFNKVDKIDMETPIANCEFLLRGISEYGTDYYEVRTSDSSGVVKFSDIEIGSYELLEIDCDSDWQLNQTVYSVTVNRDGSVLINCDKRNDNYVIGNSARIHGDLTFYKEDVNTGDRLKGAKFRLSGTSKYGNDVLLYAESGNSGKVLISDIELGTYDLVEVQAPNGYLIDKRGWKVVVDDSGVVSVYKDDEPVEKNEFGYMILTNEPKHNVRFLKSSSYGDNVYLEGAKFELSGVSDWGTDVRLYAVSGSEVDGGLVEFLDLEPGSYILKEIEAPAEHELDTVGHAVRVNRDGTFEIEGIGFTKIGNTDIYDFKDVKSKGVVKITKIWQDASLDSERKIPGITISTKKPMKNPMGFTVTFDAGEGSYDDGKSVNECVYTRFGTLIAGEGAFKEPSAGSLEYKVVTGWYTAPTGGSQVFVDSSGNITYNLFDDSLVLYPRWAILPHYAVAVWDICKDVDINGKRMGITFGPALGANYTTTYRNHNATGLTSSGNAHRCIHDDLWETIVGWNIKDPYVYEQCLTAGCTKAVPLDPAGYGFPAEYWTASKCTGDGPNLFPCLYYTTKGHMHYNAANSTSGGWGVSRIRASLNGFNSLTDVSVANGVDYRGTTLPDVCLYTADCCGLNCFPDVLQSAIGERKVNYSVCDYYGRVVSTHTCYDKLWLPSINEICAGLIFSGDSSMLSRSGEGSVYSKWAHIGQFEYVKGAVSDFIGYGTNGYADNIGLRSLGQSDSVMEISFEGKVRGVYPNMWSSQCVCFTLSR